MPNDVNNLDINDEGLKSIFGDRFHDETNLPTPAKSTTKANPAKAVKAPAIDSKLEPAKWNPVKPDPNGLERLKDCAKWMALFGGLCLLFFYWQQSGQMESSAAVPSMCVCCGLVGLTIGKNIVKGSF